MEYYDCLWADKKAFPCPFCNTFSRHEWFAVYGSEPFDVALTFSVKEEPEDSSSGPFRRSYQKIESFLFARCNHCENYSIWDEEKGVMIYPISGAVPSPNKDMPDDVKSDYKEARIITGVSPRGAAALLRLAVQKLCKHLGGSGENINADIATLVKNGLPERIQKALDTVRVIGNSAVHPGQIDLTDDAETAHKLFDLINLIVDYMISKPKAIDDLFDKKVPDNLKDAIKKRDGK